MTDQEMNKRIAEWCGWQISQDNSQFKMPGDKFWRGRGYNSIFKCIPNFCRDLNDMHEAEKVMKEEQQTTYADTLFNRGDEGCGWMFNVAHATARQRAEAFLKTIGRWEE